MVKVVALSAHAYTSLKGIKSGGESFSDVVLRLVVGEAKRSLLEFAGIWKAHDELEEIFQRVEKERGRFRSRDVLIP